MLVLGLVSCKKTVAPIHIDESYGEYIYGHTTGIISASDAVYIQLAKSVDGSLVGTKVADGIFTISPSIKGTAYWQDSKTISITPDVPWTYDETYTFTVDLQRIYEEAEITEANPSFSLHIQPLRLKIRTNEPTYSKESVILNGWIKSTENTEHTEIEKLLSVSQKGNSNLNITWQHHSDKNHNFTIDGIDRKNDISQLKLKWKGNDLDGKFSGSRSFRILPKGVFSVVNTELSQEGSKSIKISFSDGLDSKQNLSGLISVKDHKGKCTFDIGTNTIDVYPPKSVNGKFTLIVDKSIKRYDGTTLKRGYEIDLSFDPTPPKVILSGKGVIVPSTEEVIFPFRAQNLKGVTVEVFKIYQDNVLQFLQHNKISSNYGLHPVGRIIHQQHVDLTTISTEDNSNGMVRYALDISKFTELDLGAIYQVRIAFSMADVHDYPCKEEHRVASAVLAQRDGYTTIMRESYGQGYQWSDRNDPCKSSYYTNDRFVMRNIFSSNIGIITKMNAANEVLTTITDLRDVSPTQNATLEYYDYQQQLITTTSTDSKGIAKTILERKPAFLIVKSDGQYGYESLQDRDANSLSDFNVSGRKKSDGIDGYIYGERGVWRPGDTIFLDFVLEDKLHSLPSEHPVSIAVDDARVKNQYRKTATQHVGGIYHFSIPTLSSAVTGNWRATVKVGGKKFRKNLKVETVKPNRIKVAYDKESLDMSEKSQITLTADWLHGVPASDLKAKVDMSLIPVKTVFDGYKSYHFDDPARKMKSYPFQIYDGLLDGSGKSSISIKKDKAWMPAGKLKARLEAKIFEKGGNFSIDSYTIPVDIYESYVGLQIPTNRWGSKYISQKSPKPIEIVLVDKDGKPLRNKSLNIGLYQARWNWWYDRGHSGRYQYNSSNHLGAIQKKTIKTDAQGKASYHPILSGYGNYMVRVCDEETGHCTGGMFYTGNYYRGSTNQEGPSQLIFKSDKTSYSTGEDINLEIPSTKDSKIFVSIENGSKVLQAFWIDGKKDITKLSIPTDAEMNSNIYIHAHLVQPHHNGENDLPMRMYGVIPVSVIDKSSQLTPEISMPDEIQPNNQYKITVSEKSGKPMFYTLAVVDEGLLSLTRYKTPDPWNQFYSKQALGVKTWDMYDYVLSGYGGTVDQYISIGGDAAFANMDNVDDVNRFVPVVRHLGPYRLSAGQTTSHRLTMPNYIGAVRVMAVARYDDKYGSTDKIVPVKKPLMVQTTLPRVLGPGESLSLPANIWAMEDNIRNVSISLETSDNISVVGSTTNTLAFSRKGDQLTHFDIKVGSETGAATFKTSASSGNESAYEEINIVIRNPNPYTSEVLAQTLQPGETWTTPYSSFGSPGTNEGILEVSNLPSVNFGRRLRYLIRYPYGCIEQTTSSVFSQLYLDDLTDLDVNQALKTENNIIAGIKRLGQFQKNSGGFTYWIGNRDISNWGTNYAGHFLLEAKDKGYAVPSQMLKDFVKYQTKASTTYSDGALHQAYRLYTLARAGEPNVGAMNRLRNQDKLSQTATYFLAAAYALIGQKKAATDLIHKVSTEIEAYSETGNTYGSHVRDMAIIAMAQHKIGNQADAISMITNISRFLGSNNWYSTHTTGFALSAMGQIYSEYAKDDLKYTYSLTGNKEAVQTPKSMSQKTIDIVKYPQGEITVTNNSTTIQFAKVILSGKRPPLDIVKAAAKHIKLSLAYTDTDGKAIDPTVIRQGTDFFVTATVQNLGTRSYNIDELALSQIFPSGWEIQNDRISGDQSNPEGIDYQNIRDDRVYTFFDIYGKKTKVIKTRLTAAYAGRFYLSPTVVEAMYDNEIQANTEGKWIEVVK